jgi:hypothetical protein
VGAAETFVPSAQWQDIPDWAILPNGGHYRFDLKTGVQQARWDPPIPGPDAVKCKPASDVLNEIYTLVGAGAVLLPLPFGTKRSQHKNWPALRFVDTQTPRYQLNLVRAVNNKGNVGVVLGPASDGLVAIDLDRDELVDPFLALTPVLRTTLRTYGARGCQIWLRAKGEYPNGQAVYTIQDVGGQKVAEWRCGGEKGAQSVIWGAHPNGMRYRRLVAAPAIEIDFEAIGWPAGWVLPWEKKAPRPRTPQRGFTGTRGPDIAQRIRAYIDKVDLAIEGESGSTPTFRLACTLVRDWACERDEAIGYMHHYSQNRCKPPWSDTEIEHKVDDAIRRTQGEQRGRLLGQRQSSSSSPLYVAPSPPSAQDEPPTRESFPLSCLPPVLGDMAQAISASIRVPLELSGPLVLGITSGAIGKGLTLKSGADRMIRGNLYLLGIAMSGDGKSSACRLAADPIQQTENSNLGFFTEISKPEIKAELRI